MSVQVCYGIWHPSVKGVSKPEHFKSDRLFFIQKDIEMEPTFYLAHYRVVDAVSQSVKKHSAETSLFAKKFAGKIGLDLIGELLGLLHDFGKYSFEYQCYIKSAVGLLCPGDNNYIDPKRYKGKIDHSTAGAQWIWKALKDEVKINKTGSGNYLLMCSFAPFRLD